MSSEIKETIRTLALSTCLFLISSIILYIIESINLNTYVIKSLDFLIMILIAIGSIGFSVSLIKILTMVVKGIRVR